MRKLEHHVVVIGASQSGLTCAAALARNGWDVTVYDQLPRVERTPERTLVITPEFIRYLPRFDPGLVKNRIRTFRVWTDHRNVDVPIAEPDLVIERRELIRQLALEAAQAGARLRWGVRLLAVGLDGETLKLGLFDHATGEFFSENVITLIAADGARSTVAGMLDCDGRLSVPILQAQIRTPKANDPSVVDTWFVPERTPYFFWRIPESEHVAAVGYVARDRAGARREFYAFLSQLGGEVIRTEAAMVPVYRPFQRPYREIGRNRVYFVGDAAGHVKVTTVGGTVTGIAGAAAAARAILHGTDYWAELRELRRELDAHFLVRLVMDQFTTPDYIQLLRCLNRPVLDLLHRTNRDRFAKIFFQVLAAQPRLIALGGKALLKAAWKVLQ